MSGSVLYAPLEWEVHLIAVKSVGCIFFCEIHQQAWPREQAGILGQ